MTPALLYLIFFDQAVAIKESFVSHLQTAQRLPIGYKTDLSDVDNSEALPVAQALSNAQYQGQAAFVRKRGFPLLTEDLLIQLYPSTAPVIAAAASENSTSNSTSATLLQDEVSTRLVGDLMFPSSFIDRLLGTSNSDDSVWWSLLSLPVQYQLTGLFADGCVKGVFREAVLRVSASTGISFVESNSADSSFISVEWNDKDEESCYSTLGLIAGLSPKIVLGRRCTYIGQIMHLVLHALGVPHEWNRYDRDGYVDVMPESAISDDVAAPTASSSSSSVQTFADSDNAVIRLFLSSWSGTNTEWEKSIDGLIFDLGSLMGGSQCMSSLISQTQSQPTTTNDLSSIFDEFTTSSTSDGSTTTTTSSDSSPLSSCAKVLSVGEMYFSVSNEEAQTIMGNREMLTLKDVLMLRRMYGTPIDTGMFSDINQTDSSSSVQGSTTYSTSSTPSIVSKPFILPLPAISPASSLQSSFLESTTALKDPSILKAHPSVIGRSSLLQDPTASSSGTASTTTSSSSYLIRSGAGSSGLKCFLSFTSAPERVQSLQAAESLVSPGIGGAFAGTSFKKKAVYTSLAVLIGLLASSILTSLLKGIFKLIRRDNGDDDDSEEDTEVTQGKVIIPRNSALDKSSTSSVKESVEKFESEAQRLEQKRRSSLTPRKKSFSEDVVGEPVDTQASQQESSEEQQRPADEQQRPADEQQQPADEQQQPADEQQQPAEEPVEERQQE